MLFNSGAGKDSWEFLGLQGDQTSQSQTKSTLNIHWKDWCWSWSSNTLATWCKEPTHWKKTLKLGKIEGKRRRGQQRMRWLDSITNLMDMKLSKLWEIVHRGAWTQLSDLKTTMPQNLHRFFPGWEWRTSNTAPYRQFATFSAHAICFYPCQQFSPCSLLRLEILVNVLDGIITQHILFLSVLQGNFAALPLHRQTSVCKGGICISHPAKKRGGEMERRAAWGRAGIGSALDLPEESECSLESHSFKIIPINNLLKYNILLKIKALIESSQSVPINPSIYHPSTYSLIKQLFFFF